MPHSIGSAPSSMGSNNSKRFNRRYRTINSKSEVDENLFGTPNRVKQAQSLRDNRSNSHNETASASVDGFHKQSMNNLSASQERKQAATNRSYIKHVTKDLIRDILVPEEPKDQAVVIDRDTYKRLLNACNYKSKEEREADKEILNREKDKIIKEINDRKKQIQYFDNQRKKNEKLEDFDLQAKEEAEYLLKRANTLRQEQEDEIKHLNELILNAKVHAIRDAQVMEKHQIKKETVDEEKRLDNMMELDRKNAIKMQEEIERKRVEEQREGAKVILRQIEDNRQEKLMKDELREQENAVLLQYLDQLQKEDYDELKKKKAQQKVLAGELLEANKEIEKIKDLRKQQEIMADIKVLEYQKEKAIREAAYEAEQEKKRQDKEKDVARLRSLQERARDLQAEKDTLRAKREQERKEREWREKEKQGALKKKRTEDEMKMAREWQIKNKEHFLAVEAAKDRSEFERVLKAQLELAEKERSAEYKHRDNQSNYIDHLKKQIKENENHRVDERKAFFEEGVRLDEEARQRRQKLDEIKQKKLNELRLAGIPDKYCADIERKANAHANICT